MDPHDIYIQYFDGYELPFVPIQDVCEITKFQHGNMRSLIDNCLRRGDIKPENARADTYPSVTSRKQVKTYAVDRIALQTIYDTSYVLGTGVRGERMEEIINYLCTEELAAFDGEPEDEIEAEVPQAKVEAGSEVERRFVTVAVVKPESKDVDPVVKVIDGRVMADSRDVAATFGKEHYNVIRDIRGLSCSDNFHRLNFEAFEINDLTGISTSHVMMTKDGFTFLVMGFTGEKAARFKEGFIEKFNALEAQAKARQDFLLDDLIENPMRSLELIKGLLGRRVEDQATIDAQGSTIGEQSATIAEMKPKADALDRMGDLKGSRNITLVAQACGIKVPTLVRWLIDKNWVRRDRSDHDRLIPASSGLSGGYIDPHQGQRFDEDKRIWKIVTTPWITPRGEKYIRLHVEPDHPAYLKKRNEAQGKLPL